MKLIIPILIVSTVLFSEVGCAVLNLIDCEIVLVDGELEKEVSERESSENNENDPKINVFESFHFSSNNKVFCFFEMNQLLPLSCLYFELHSPPPEQF